MTVPLYWRDQSLMHWTATVLASSPEAIVLDESAFYPGGGGQPADVGQLEWAGVFTRIDGVSTISFRLDVGGFQQYWRIFYLAHDGGVIQVSIACGGAAPLSMLETSIMNQTLSTLRFLPEAAP